MTKVKYFVILLAILLLSLGVSVAADTDNITQESDTMHTISDTPSYDNSIVTNYDNNIEDKTINTQKRVQKKSTTQSKGEEEYTVTVITEDNFEDCFKVSSTKITLNQNYFVAGKNYIINFTYFPTGNKLQIDNLYNNKYKNSTFKIVGTINDTNIIINKASAKAVILEDLTLNYNPDYTGEYVTAGKESILNRVTINVDTERNISSVPLFINGNKTIVENCTINARLPSTQIDWDHTNIPNGIGVWVNAYNVTLANNIINIEESAILTSTGGYRSLYGIYLRGRNHIIHNNTMSLQGTQYMYGVVVRASNNNITNNHITSNSEYYSAGVNIEGNAMVNNSIRNNYIEATAGYDVTDNGNPDVAYACLILDFSCGGQYYAPSAASMRNNEYINNTVVCEGRQVYGLEVWGGINATFNNNHITATGILPMGIGAIGINTTINNNIINVYGTSNSTEGSADYILPRTAGVYAYGMTQGNSITNNTIYTETGRALLFEEAQNMQVENNYLVTQNYAYVIEVDDKNNTFKNNVLIGEDTTSELIKDKTSNNTYINNRMPTKSQLNIDAPDFAKAGETINITISLKEPEDLKHEQYVTVQINDEEAQILSPDTEGNINIQYTPNTNIINIKAEYTSYTDLGSTATKKIMIGELIILTPENYDTYITDGKFNDKVPDGAIIDVSGKFDNERYAFTVNKPVNILSTKGDAFFSFFSTPKSEGSSELPEHSFIINKEAAGTNITGITFENTMIVTTETHDVTFDNITVYCTSGYGWGRGSTSIRNSQNVTVKNSYFNTTDNNGVSTLVFAASQNGLVENCTIVGSGFIGNLVYATTYNVAVNDTYGNNNITIRNNKIIARNLSPGTATCYSVCLIGDNITVEDNYIENSNNYLIMTQYKDNEYEVAGNTGSLLIRNNEFGQGKIGITFDPCTITGNTFYGEVTLDTTNNTIKENNIIKDATENPYTTLETAQDHDAILKVEAPTNYYYNTQANINITLTEDDNVTPINDGRIEVYVEGVPYKNITVNNNKINFVYENETLGTHRIRFWYYTPTGNISNSQKLVTIESLPIGGKLELQTPDEIHIGDTITLNVTYTLDQEVPLDVNITFALPGQSSITVPAKDKQVSLQTTITNDYIRDILGGREQNIKITANTNDTNVEITGINQKLGVQKANTQITITPNTTVYNVPTTITATVNTPSNLTINTGTITFTDQKGNTISTSNVKNNQATTTITFNNTGVNPITATYSETTYYQTNTTTTNIQVQKQDTKITLNKIPTTTYNTNVTLTGTLTDKNGNTLKNMQITIQINNDTNTTTTNNNGVFTYTFTAPMAGQNNITATYTGNNNYKATNTTTTFNVNKQNLKITFDKIKDVVYGHEVTITGTFTDGQQNPRANIALRIFINGKGISTRTDTNGRFSVNSKVGVIGTNNVTASHAGGANYNPTNTSTTYKMLKQDLKITVNNISTVIYGSSVKITGTLKDGDNNIRANTGVKILINGKSATAKTDKKGNYAFTTKIGKLGINNVTVSHAGGANYNPTSASTTYTVVKQNLKITLDKIGTVTYGSVTITGLFTDSNNNPRANTGLKITINGKTATAKTDAQGKFTLTTKVGVIGTNNVTAYHNGGSNYNPTSTNITFKMVKQDLKVTLDPIKDVTYGNSVVITGTFTDASGKIRANSALKIIINGKTLTTRTDAQGKFKATSKVGVIGTNNVTVSHNGGTGFNPTSTTTTFKMVKQDLKITINPITNVKKGSTLTVTGTFTDANGKIRANTNLKVKLNGVEHTTKTDTKGVFTFKTTANKLGTNTITISHTGGANYNPTNTTKTFTVTA